MVFNHLPFLFLQSTRTWGLSEGIQPCWNSGSDWKGLKDLYCISPCLGDCRWGPRSCWHPLPPALTLSSLAELHLQSRCPLWPPPMWPLCHETLVSEPKEEVVIKLRPMPGLIRWCLGNHPNSPRKQGTFTVLQLIMLTLLWVTMKILFLPGDPFWPGSRNVRRYLSDTPSEPSVHQYG